MAGERSILRQIRDFESGSSPIRKRRMAFAIVALIALASVLMLTATSTSSALSRDPLKWPFSPDSIWNLPIGAGAVYLPAGIAHATAMSSFVDTDILVMTPTAPLTSVFTNYDDWSAGSRCAATGPWVFNAPIPAGFLYLGNYMGNPDGTTTNAAAAFLAQDGHTIIQTQPVAHCTAAGPWTSHYLFGNEDIYGTGVSGAHGGSGLSAIGGTIRLGELVPGGTIPHALKLNMDSLNFYPGLGGYRWPAWKSDAGGAGYSGTIPQVRMGSLLALNPNANFALLETEAGRIVAHAMQDYGAYIVDSAGWSVYGLEVERSPAGSVRDDFLSRFGYAIDVAPNANGWARDMDRIMTSLFVIDNWNQASWSTVSASNGLLGVGLGAPRVPWALPFGAVAPPIPSPSVKIMAAGDSNTFGIGSPGGYRVSLYQTLTSRKFAFMMVGSQSDGPPELLQKAHEGYSGYTIANLTAILPGKLTLNPPDVVLLLIGTNDASGSMDMPNAPARLGRLLDSILAKPSVQRVIMSTLPPFNLVWPAGNQMIMDFNAALPGLASTRPRVSIVDLYPQINAAADMSDGVHLNANGAAKLGLLFANAVTGAPQPPAPPVPIIKTMGLDFQYSRSLLNLTFTLMAWNGTAPYRFTLSWGDGTMTGWSARMTVSHNFPKAGLYRITLTAADSSSNVAYLTKDAIAG